MPALWSALGSIVSGLVYLVIANLSGMGCLNCVFFMDLAIRVYFGQHNDVTVILLCGGDKKSQNKDLQKAKHYWKNYKDQS